MNLPGRHRRSRLAFAVGRWLVCGAGVASLALGLAGACGPFDEVTAVVCRSRAEFPAVSAVLERRCGTLDCHGSLYRPLRIYGFSGLRLLDDPAGYVDGGPAGDPGAVPGGDGTTEAELEFNWQAVCGLEPERMNAVVAGEVAPDGLQLLRKPLMLEHHKGGQVFFRGSPGYTCLESWLAGAVYDDECQLELVNP